MKLILSFLVLLALSMPANAALAIAAPVGAPSSSEQFERTYVEQQLGRKLTFKERIGLSIVRGKTKRQERKIARKRAGTNPVDGYAIASLVCGILGFLTGITAIPAIILGVISLGRFRRDPQFRSGKGMAIAGIILGGLVIFAFLLLIAIFAGIG